MIQLQMHSFCVLACAYAAAVVDSMYCEPAGDLLLMWKFDKGCPFCMGAVELGWIEAQESRCSSLTSSPPAARPPRPPKKTGANRKLAQWGNNRRRRDYPNSADAQFARNQAGE